MTALLALSLILQTTTLDATDDVWLYPHAYDQLSDPLLRIWGDGTNAVGDIEMSTISFSLVRFDLATVKGQMGKLKKATLVLWHSEEANFTKSESEDSPLEIRLVGADFDEDKWSMSSAGKFTPKKGPEDIVGKAALVPSGDGKPFKFSVELSLSKSQLLGALKGDAIGFALTTKMEPGGAENGSYYNVCSRAADKELRPTLVLEFED